MVVDMISRFITDVRMSGEPYDVLVQIVQFINEPELDAGQTVRALVDSFGRLDAVFLDVCIRPVSFTRDAR